MRLALIVLTSVALAGCAHGPAPEAKVQVIEKAVPVATPCVSDATPKPPSYSASLEDLKAMSPGERYAAAVAGFVERDQRLREIEPVLEACRG